jgi:ATP-binding cassette subfamily B protein
MRRLVRFIVPYRGRVALALLLLFGAALAELAGPLLVKQAIDGPLRNRDVSGVWPIFGLYLGVLLLTFLFRFGQIWIMQTVGQQVMVDVRMRIFSHIQRMSLAFFDRNPVGRLITRITNDIDALNEFLTQGLVALIGDFVTLGGIIAVMFYLNWRLALLSLMVLPLVAITTFTFQRFMRRAYRLVRQRLARINAYLNEQLTGILVVQLFNGERRAGERFDELNRDYRGQSAVVVRLRALFPGG